MIRQNLRQFVQARRVLEGASKGTMPMLSPYLGAVVAASMLVLFAGLFHLDEKRKERAKRAG